MISIPEGLLALIRASEGLRLKVYQDTGGVWTIGYGSTGKDIGPGLVWTLEQAEERMQRDALHCCIAVQAICPPLSAPRLAAAADFAYNLGLHRFADSTLHRKINRGDFAGAALEFEKWVHDNGQILDGLVTRRKAEKALFLTA